MLLDERPLQARVQSHIDRGGGAACAEVPEQRIAVFLTWLDRRGRRNRARRQETIELRSQPSSLGGFSRRVFPRVQRNEILASAADEAEMVPGERVDRLSSEPEIRRERFGVDRGRRHHRVVVVENRPQRSPGEAARHGCTNQVENRRQDVDVLHRKRDAAATALAVRLLDDEGHAQRAIVERETRADVTAIADQHDRRVVVQSALLERGRQSHDRHVGIASRHLHEQEESLAVL